MNSEVSENFSHQYQNFGNNRIEWCQILSHNRGDNTERNSKEFEAEVKHKLEINTLEQT